MSEAVMLDKVKAAMLECSTKSEQLEEVAGQLTVQKLRAQLAIESRLSSLEQQLRIAGQQLLAELASNHDSLQAKIHHQQHLVLKFNMQLSSALAKELVSTDLLSKMESNMVLGLKGLEVQFIPSSTLRDIAESDIGNLQFGHLLPSQVVLTFSTSISMDNSKLITCVLTSPHVSVVESLKQILTVVVKKDQVVVDHQLEEEKGDHSTNLKVMFVAKCGGKYFVTASMHGEMVQGSPMVVEVGHSVGASLPKVEDVENNVKFVNDDDVSEMKEKDQQEAVEEIKARNRKFEDLKGEAKIFDVAVTSKGDGVSAATEDLSSTEETDDLTVSVDETNAKTVEFRLKPSPEPRNYSPNIEPEAPSLSEVAEAVEDPVFSVGSSCLVKWCEDKVWCRARVDNFVKGVYEVTFVDYGNKVTVGMGDMVVRAADIPDDQLEMVDPLVWKWHVGMTCVAKWSEDNTWYNGVVSAVGGGPSYTIMFVDYGNIEAVSEENIVESARDIPADERENVDICVIIGPDGNVATNDVIDVVHADPQALPENIIDIKDMSDDSCATPQISQLVADLAAVEENISEAAACVPAQEDDNSAVRRRFEVGSFCIAEWAEDSTWYNGLVIMVNSDGSYQVEFVDYGNVENVIEDKMVEAMENVPAGSIIDEFVKTVHGEVVREEKPKSEVVNNSQEVLGSPELEEAVLIEEPMIGDDAKNDTSEVVVQTVLCEESEQVCKFGSPPNQVSPIAVQDDDAPWTPSVGSVCCAKWSDRVWYNARVDEVMRGGKEVFVTFIDYGNTDKVPVRKLVKDSSLIPEGAKINTLVKQGSPAVDQDDCQVLGNVNSEDPISSSTPIHDGLSVGEECVALWAEDNVWYNARIKMIDQQAEVAEVEFFDYGNSDLVSLCDVYRKFSSVPLARPGEEITVDPNVSTGQGEEVDHVVDHTVLIDQEQGDLLVDSSAETATVYGSKAEPVSLLSLVTKDQHGKMILNAVVVNTITAMEGVLGMTILPGGTLVTAVEKENTVKMWSRDGLCTGEVVGDREFSNPSDVVCLGGMGFAVKDKKGIMMFDMQGKFVRKLAVDKLDTCSGMAVDNLGRIVIINKCGEGDEGRLTLRGETDILYIDIMKEKVVKRVEMVDIIAEKEKTICKALTMYKDKLYVVDNGLDCVYTLFHEDGEDQAEVFGSPGRREAQFSGVSAVVLDDEGNSVISDTRNNRLQLFSSEWEFVGFVKVQPSPLARPCVMCLDKEVRELVVHNMGTSQVVRYALG